jgi:hypothetical protein
LAEAEADPGEAHKLEVLEEALAETAVIIQTLRLVNKETLLLVALDMETAEATLKAVTTLVVAVVVAQELLVKIVAVDLALAE